MNTVKLLIIITGGVKRDGITLSTYDCFEKMNRKDMEITLLVVNQPNDLMIKRFQSIGINSHTLSMRTSNPIKYFFKLLSYVRKQGFDVVHVHGSSALMAVDLLAAKFGGCPVRIAHSRNTKCDKVTIDKILRPLFNRSFTKALACGKDAGNWLFRRSEFEVFHNGKNLMKYAYNKEIRKEVRRGLKLTDDELIIGHVGSFNYQKNHAYLIYVINELRKYRQDIKMILIGEGDLKATIERDVKSLGLEEYVIFTGQVDNVPDYLQAMDLMLLPSRFEGLPNVIIEWQAAGLPMIMSDQVTDECIVSDLVQVMPISVEPEEWAKAIMSTAIVDREGNKKDIQERLTQNGFNLSISAIKLKETYMNLIREQRGSEYEYVKGSFTIKD